MKVLSGKAGDPQVTDPTQRPFGFRVIEHTYDWRHVGPEREWTKVDLDPSQWAVQLPHQCNAWEITDEYHGSVSHAEAVAALQRFIAEAQEALAHLERHEEFNSE